MRFGNLLKKMVLLIFVCIIVCPRVAAQQPDQSIPTSIDLKRISYHQTIEDVLPKGALFYLRAINLQLLLENLDDLVASFLPEKAVPAEFRAILSKSDFLLSFLSLKLFGKVVPLDQISSLLGIRLSRPSSLAVYTTDPKGGFILSIPISTSVNLIAQIESILKPSAFEKVSVGDTDAFHILPAPTVWPRDLYVLASDTTAFVCGSIETARLLTTKDDRGGLSRDPAIAKGIMAYKNSDLELIVSADFIKAQLPVILEKFSPQSMTPIFRKEIFGFILKLDPAAKIFLEIQLRRQMGISGILKFIPFLEATATGIYEVMLAELVKWLNSTDGICVAIDFEEKYQTTSLSFFSEKIDPAQTTQPLPKEKIKSALHHLPGNKTFLSAIGQTPQSSGDRLVRQIIRSIEHEMVKRKLHSTFLSALKMFYENHRIKTRLESTVPWTLRTTIDATEETGTDEFTSIDEWFRSPIFGIYQNQLNIMTLLPAVRVGILEEHFENSASVINQNETSIQELMERELLDRRMYDVASRFQKEILKGGVNKLILETVYKTKIGFLGYQQHELINRRVSYYKNKGGYILAYDGNEESLMAVFSEDEISGQPLPPSVIELIDKAPANVNSLFVLRTLQLISDAIDLLEDIENVIHRELDDFLLNTEKIKRAHAAETLPEKQLDLNFPFLVMSLNMDDSGNLYCVLPGGFHYPRPKIVPELKALSSDYRRLASSIGGGACFTSVNRGEARISFVQSTEALALLVKTLVNNFYERYKITGSAKQELERLLLHPLDGKKMYNEETIAINPTWYLIMR